MFTAETKSQLAKLLATENIRVEHRKLRTAAFDPKNRVLYCPIWKDMSGALYDLLMGHEVGHALYTPADGWHDAACSNGKNFKAFLNVIEDARIEKKIKRRYPGLRPSFVKAYSDLMAQDFFGVQGKDLNKLSFINRLNLYTKSDYTLSIQFNAKEKMLVDRVRATETWQDVLDITGDVWQYSVEEQQENDFEFDFDMSFGDNEMSEDDFDYDGNNSNSAEGESEEGEEEGSVKTKGSNGESGETDEEEGQETVMNRHKDSESTDDFFEPSCETDEIYRKKESELLDETSKDYVYVKLPKPNLQQIVTPASRVQELLTLHYNNPEYSHWKSDIDQCVVEFKKRNERYISLLAKEFEMKKAAKRYAKAKVSSTGDIDISRLYKYKVDDNIFRKVMKVPNGKSHGLMMIFDRSGSMFQNMAGTIEQMLIVTLFCRKVNIPFSVYGFGNSDKGRWHDYGVPVYENHKTGFSSEQNELGFYGVYLREYLNSKMSKTEFNNALRNMVALMNSYPNGKRYADRKFWYPECEDLSNTPMNEALTALIPITKEFRKVNNLDIVNTVLLHDGDADYTRSYHTASEVVSSKMTTKIMQPRWENVFVVDQQSKKEYQLLNEPDLQKIVMKIYQKQTGSKIFGFYISSGTGSAELKYIIREHYFNDKGEPIDVYRDFDKLKVMMNKMKKEKLLVSHKDGYEKFFLLTGGKSLVVDDGELEIEGKVTTSKLATAFKKFNSNRQVNRALISKFIEGIATE